MSYRINALVTVCAAALLSSGLLWLPRRGSVSQPTLAAPGAQRAIRSFNIPVYFEPNLGQLPQETRFAGHGLGYGLTFKTNEVEMTWPSPQLDKRNGRPAAAVPADTTMRRTVSAGADR